MAEVVFQNLEEMLPALEEMEREGVFSREELRLIIKRRTDFEYKLQKRTIEKHDLLNYLEYEVKLDALRKKRSKKLKLKVYNKAAVSMGKKIHSLFRKGLMKFSDDLSLWMQYIDFCKKTSSHRALGLTYGKLLQNHSNNSDIWLMAAKHEAEEMNSIENARLLFQKGLRVNKDSLVLWHEYFRLELMHVDKIKKRKRILIDGGIDIRDEDEAEEPEQIEDFLMNKTAEIVYSSAIKTISSNIDFRLKFITICQEFEDSHKLEEHIFENLNTDFQDDEALHEVTCVKPITVLQKKIHVIKDFEWLEVEEKVKNNFQEALKLRRTNKMYEKYINCFAKLMNESNSPEQMHRRLEIIFGILQGCEQDNCMTEISYLFWSEVLSQTGDDTASLECLQKGLKSFNKSFDLWQNYLFMKIESSSSWEALSSEFKESFSLLDEKDQLPIWKLFIDVALTQSNSEIEKAFSELFKASNKIKEAFLPMYLDWLYENKGLISVREFYGKQLKHSVCLKSIQSCINIEEKQGSKSLKQLRFLHEKAINDFGETSVEVWLSYIQMEKENAPEDFDTVGKLYMKAKKTLTGKLNAELITQYTLM